MSNPFERFRQQAGTPAAVPAAMMAGSPVGAPAAQTYVAPAVAVNGPPAAYGQGVQQPAYRPMAGSYAGTKVSEGQLPTPTPGKYIFEIVKTWESYRQDKDRKTFHANLKILDVQPFGGQVVHPPGSVVSFIQIVNGKGAAKGRGRVKAFVMGATGFAKEADFDAFDPVYSFIDRVSGAASYPDGRPLTYPDGQPIPENPLGGQKVAATVTQGNPDGKGGYYMEYAWEPYVGHDGQAQ